MAVARLPLVVTHPAWRAAQVVGVLLTVALVIAFVVAPEPSLRLLWDMVIPLLPAVFLVNPMLWRNVCPLATLNDLGGHRRAAPTLRTAQLPAAWAIGIVLLLLLVPARRFLFNAHGIPMAVTVTSVATLALVSGLVLSRRAGFCNSICPVLPVEKLYGQAPVVEIGSARCSDCNRCAALGCPDIAGRKSAVQSVAGAGGARWLFTPFGLFAATFPGFIVGYFTTVDGPVASAASVYGHIALWGAVSAAVAVVLIMATRARSTPALFVLGGASITVYYWFAAPRLAQAYGGGPVVEEAFRAIVLLGIAAWAVRGWRRIGGATSPTAA